MADFREEDTKLGQWLKKRRTNRNGRLRKVKQPLNDLPTLANWSPDRVEFRRWVAMNGTITTVDSSDN